MASWKVPTGDRRPAPAADPTSAQARTEGGAAVSTILEILGYVLLLMAGLAMVLLAVILVLLQANFILHLVNKLTKRLRYGNNDVQHHTSTADQSYAQAAPKQGEG
jgi:hypothetical protein